MKEGKTGQPCIVCGDSKFIFGRDVPGGMLCGQCALNLLSKKAQSDAEQEKKWIDELIRERKP